MPFRYVDSGNGDPVMPAVSFRGILRCEMCTDRVQGMLELIKKDADKSFDDLF